MKKLFLTLTLISSCILANATTTFHFPLTIWKYLLIKRQFKKTDLMIAFYALPAMEFRFVQVEVHV